MKKLNLLLVSVILTLTGYTQSLQPTISAMKWGADYKLHVKLSNDSAYVMNVKGLYHTGKNLFVDTTDKSTTYYPVNLDKEFIDYIKNKKIEEQDSASGKDTIRMSYKTLWSATHANLGGGYIHFVNCVVYSLESQQLKLSDPMFKRPVTDWKPKPMTATYKRTRKWEYYYPSTQKLAQKEYKLRLKENDLRDLQGVPSRFLDLFMETSQSDYEKLVQERKLQLVAQIDLVRLLLGAKYLGEDQIRHISSRVLTAVVKYNVNAMPSVIIFDDYNAAVAMSLNSKGYEIDYIVYSDGETVSGADLEGRTAMIEGLVKNINEANERVFRKRLQIYYQKVK